MEAAVLDLPAEFWDDFMGAGPQAFWLAAREAARLMPDQGSGLIAAISEPMIDPDKLSGNRVPEIIGESGM